MSLESDTESEIYVQSLSQGEIAGMLSDEAESDAFDAPDVDELDDEPIPGTEAVLKQRLKAAIMYTIGKICENEVLSAYVMYHTVQSESWT